MEGWVELICPRCGGKVKVDRPTLHEFFKYKGEGVYLCIDSPGAIASCIHCGTDFVKGSEVRENPQIHVDQRGSSGVNVTQIVNQAQLAIGSFHGDIASMNIKPSGKFLIEAKCSNCGENITLTANYCSNCGIKISGK